MGIAFWGDRLYVVYANEERYIAENPNQDNPYSIAKRDRCFLHQLKIQSGRSTAPFTLSNGYLVEMVYLEETYATEPVEVQNLTWRIALPSNSDRQKLVSIAPVGLPFQEEINDGQRVAVFQLGNLQADEAHYFGWKAVLELWGIKYEITPEDVEQIPPCLQNSGQSISLTMMIWAWIIHWCEKPLGWQWVKRPTS